MNKKELLKQIKTLVNCGEIVQVYTPTNNMNLWLSEDTKFILWRNFEQSAIKNNMQDLTWLVNNILEGNKESMGYKVVNSTVA